MQFILNMNKNTLSFFFLFVLTNGFSQNKYTIDISTNSPCDKSELIHKGELKGLSVYPNPNDGNFNIELPYKSGKLNLINSMGQLIISQNIDDKNLKIDFPLASGFYTIQIIHKGTLITEKMEVISK